jgi:TRAP-type C4-dicarboxylate transport system permease small subunit
VPSRGGGVLAALLRWTRRLEDGLLVVLLAAMIALAGAQILLRNLADTGIAWGDPLLRVLVLWVGLMGAMAATRDHNHIAVDVLSRLLPPRSRDAVRAATDLFAALVCAVLAYHGGRLVALDLRDGTRAFAGVPAWVCELIIPLAFAAMALRFLAGAGLRLGQTMTGKGGSAGGESGSGAP